MSLQRQMTKPTACGPALICPRSQTHAHGRTFSSFEPAPRRFHHTFHGHNQGHGTQAQSEAAETFCKPLSCIFKAKLWLKLMLNKISIHFVPSSLLLLSAPHPPTMAPPGQASDPHRDAPSRAFLPSMLAGLPPVFSARRLHRFAD